MALEFNENKDKRQFVGVNGEVLTPVASFMMRIRPLRNSRKPQIFADFRVFKEVNSNIIGDKDAKALRMLLVGADVPAEPSSVLEVEEEDEEEVEPSPTMKTPPVVFDLIGKPEEIEGKHTPYFNVGYAFEDQAMKRLKRMERCDIIEEINHLPKFLSGVSTVEKSNGDFR